MKKKWLRSSVAMGMSLGMLVVETVLPAEAVAQAASKTYGYTSIAVCDQVETGYAYFTVVESDREGGVDVWWALPDTDITLDDYVKFYVDDKGTDSMEDDEIVCYNALSKSKARVYDYVHFINNAYNDYRISFVSQKPSKMKKKRVYAVKQGKSYVLYANNKKIATVK